MMPELTHLTLSWLNSNELESHYFEEIQSTSTWAKENAFKSRKNFRLILADKQSQGRGRNSNSWINSHNPGDSLLSTWCFRTSHSPQPILTPRLGLALYRALKIISDDLPLSLKAPNDVFLKQGKLAGLLVEVIDQGSEKEILIGLGLNVLSSPENMKAAHLNQTVASSEIFKNWAHFLSELKKQFELSCRNSNSFLTEDEMAELLLVLNRYPLLKTAYTRLEPDGTLWQSEKRISWTEL
jgi:biotin-[acetyl-CoA-carboxylase] ligase BirA-like protein